MIQIKFNMNKHINKTQST